MFDRFYRGSGAGGVRGSGLGLAIVKRIADRHHASVELGPGIEGRGLGVTVRFPQPVPAPRVVPMAATIATAEAPAPPRESAQIPHP